MKKLALFIILIVAGQCLATDPCLVARFRFDENSPDMNGLPTFQNTITVKTTGGDYTTLSEAVAAAELLDPCTSGNRVLISVGAGTFTEANNTEATFSHGGYTITGQGIANTIITGDTDGTIISIPGDDDPSEDWTITFKDLSIINSSSGQSSVAIKDVIATDTYKKTLRLDSVYLSGGTFALRISGNTKNNFNGYFAHSIFESSGETIAFESGLTSGTIGNIYIYDCNINLLPVLGGRAGYQACRFSSNRFNYRILDSRIKAENYDSNESIYGVSGSSKSLFIANTDVNSSGLDGQTTYGLGSVTEANVYNCNIVTNSTGTNYSISGSATAGKIVYVKGGSVDANYFSGNVDANFAATAYTLFDVNDDAGHGAYLMGTGSIASHSVAGQINRALSFNGTTDYVDTNSTYQTTFQDSFTISLWIKPTDGRPATTQSLITYADYKIYFELTTSGSLDFFYQAGEDEIPYETDHLFADGQETWHLLTLTLAQTTPTTITYCLYFDGVLVGTTTGGGAMSGFVDVGNLGIAGGAGEQKFIGSLDDVRIYSKALSEYEIKQLWKQGKGLSLAKPKLGNRRGR